VLNNSIFDRDGESGAAAHPADHMLQILGSGKTDVLFGLIDSL